VKEEICPLVRSSHWDSIVTLGSGQGAGSSPASRDTFSGVAERDAGRAGPEYSRSAGHGGLQDCWGEPFPHSRPGPLSQGRDPAASSSALQVKPTGPYKVLCPRYSKSWILNFQSFWDIGTVNRGEADASACAFKAVWEVASSRLRSCAILSYFFFCNPQNTSTGSVISPVYRQSNWGLERVNFSSATVLAIQSQAA
jgi:hypothetical protein